jgi:hypothetical protein
MGDLSNLVYQPNDVIADVSSKYMENTSGPNKFVYVGPFDHDPSYPLAFTEGSSSSEQPKVTFSRVHVWLKTFSDRKDHELYIIVRGSKSGYDWESCDTDIIMGVLQNERSTGMPVILCDIIEYMNSCLTSSDGDGDARSKKIADALNNGGKKGKAIQMFSSGHSLGGYLAMSLTHTALAKHLINGISFTNITGVDRTNKGRIFLKPYIIPIVFDPYLGMGSAVHSAFSSLPYVRIHSCIDTEAVIKTPTSGPHLVFGQNLSDILGRYDDVASRYFLAYIQNMYSNTDFNYRMGQFFTFHYKNVYNHFNDPKIYYRTEGVVDRTKNDMRIGHDLLQMVGSSAQYAFFHTPTKFYLKTNLPPPFDKQSFQVTRYNFPIPKTVSIIPEYVISDEIVDEGGGHYESELDLDVYVLTEDRHVRANVMKTDFSKVKKDYTNDEVLKENAVMEFEPKEQSEWLKKCQHDLKYEMEDFTSSVEDYNIVKLNSKSGKTRKSMKPSKR